MKHSKRWVVGALLVAGLLVSACGQAPASTEHASPAEVKHIEGSDLSSVTLTEHAAKRLGIQTGAISEEQVTRKRTLGGEVVAPSGGASAGVVWVKVPLSESDLNKVDRGQPVMILPLVEASGSGVTAKIVENPPTSDASEANQSLYYAVDGKALNLTPGQRVRVELVLQGSGAQHKIVPYSAVIYDLHGKTWAYTNPQPLTFVREAIDVDYIEGDRAILTAGPAAGTQVVTVGAAELFGTELGVGH